MWTTKDITNQKGKTVIVTGGNTGIGYETASALFQAGADVTIACRDKDKAAEAITGMKARKGTGTLEVGMLDLASLNSVRQFAKRFVEQHSQLHLLINNICMNFQAAFSLIRQRKKSGQTNKNNGC